MFDKQFDNFLNDKITDFSEIGKQAGKKDVTKGKISTILRESPLDFRLQKKSAGFLMGKYSFLKRLTIVPSVQSVEDFFVNKFSDHEKIMNVPVENINVSVIKGSYVNVVEWKLRKQMFVVNVWLISTSMLP